MPFIYHPPLPFEFQFENSSTGRIINSVILGKKIHGKKLKAFKQTIKDLNLQHLFTPSGIHLSSLLLLLRFFPKQFSQIIISIILGILIYFGNLFSFQRNAGIYLLKSWLQMSTPWSFFIVTFFEFLILDWRRFQSFSFSFLFLGILITYRNASKLYILEKLCLAQLTISCITLNSIGLSIFPINLISSFLMGILFPLFLVAGLLSTAGLEFFGDFLAAQTVSYFAFLQTVFDLDPLKFSPWIPLLLYGILKPYIKFKTDLKFRQNVLALGTQISSIFFKKSSTYKDESSL